MTRNDRTALAQALAMCRAESAGRAGRAGRAGQIDAKLEDEPWEDVAAFAASCCQSRTLKLQPWDLPPVDVSEDDDSDINADAVKLLRQMLAAGVSRYDPDPLKALAGAKQRSSR